MVLIYKFQLFFEENIKDQNNSGSFWKKLWQTGRKKLKPK